MTREIILTRSKKLAASSPELRHKEYTNHQYVSKMSFFAEEILGMCGKNMFDVCCEVTSHDEYVAMVKTKKRMSAKPTCCYTATFATRSLLRGSVVPAKFLLWTSTRCLQNVRHQTRWLWYGMERSTTWITERDTAQTETERILTRLVTAHSLIAVCIRSKRVFAHVIHVLTLSHPVLSSRVIHTTRGSLSTRTSRRMSANDANKYIDTVNVLRHRR